MPELAQGEPGPEPTRLKNGLVPIGEGASVTRSHAPAAAAAALPLFGGGGGDVRRIFTSRREPLRVGHRGRDGRAPVRRARRRRRGRVQARGKRPGSRPDAGEETRRVADAAPRRAAADEAGQTPEPGHLRLGESELRAELAEAPEQRELLLRLRERGRVRVRGRAGRAGRAERRRRRVRRDVDVGRRRRRRRRRPRPEPLRFPGNVSAAAPSRRSPSPPARFSILFFSPRAPGCGAACGDAGPAATLAAAAVVPLGVFGMGTAAVRRAVFRPRLAREQRADAHPR